MCACTSLLFAHVHSDLSRPLSGEVQRFAATALLGSLLKKELPVDGRCTPAQTKIAIEKFLEANEKCRQWVDRSVDLLDDELLTLFREEINGFFAVNKKTGWGLEPLDLSPIRAMDYGRMGPGKSVGVDDLTFYGKVFNNVMTTYDQDLYPWYRAAISEDYRWADAEKLRSQRYGLPRVVVGSRISVVPKNVTTGRTICSEASLNMMFQLGQGAILEDRLATYFGLQIKGQKESVQHLKNQQLAKFGSIDGSYATIDLSSASDSISLHMIREYLPKSVVWALERTRATCTRVPGLREPVQLHMISSMGNGYTFPLQTALFACIVFAVARFHGVELIKPYGDRVGTYGVFGDDIIVPAALFRNTIRLLRLLGFTPNVDKTFSEGAFRESCGADWFRGHPVRGVYIRRLSTIEDRFVAYNSLRRWEKQTGIRLPAALAYLVKSIPKEFRFWIPPWEAPDSGLWADEPPLPPRRVLFRPNDKYVGAYYSYGWRYRKKRVLARVLDVQDILPEMVNPEGLLLCFLGGFVRDMEMAVITPTGARPRYSTAAAFCVNWTVPPKVPRWQWGGVATALP